jgi:predicted phosphodiesterase
MKKVLIISDTHSYLDPRLMEHVEWCDQIWHGGDWGDVAVSDTLTALKPVFGCMVILMAHPFVRLIY